MSSKNLILALVVLIILGAGGAYYFSRSASTAVAPHEGPYKVGIVSYLSFLAPTVDGLKKGMADMGYVEGKDVVYDYQSADGNIDKARQIVDGFVDQKVDAIYAIALEAGLASVEGTKAKGSKIPIVFSEVDNPDKLGLIANYQSTGNNTTGIASDLTDVVAKNFEFLKAMKPSIKKLGLFTSTFADPVSTYMREEIRRQAPAAGLTLVEYNVQSPPGPGSTAEIKTITDKIKSGEIDALFHPTSPVLNYPDNIPLFVGLSLRLKIPSSWISPLQVEGGGLVSYGDDIFGVGVQSAHVLDKVLKGADPSTVPVEFPQKNLLYVNQKTADAIGVTIPPSILQIADKVVK